MPRLSTVPVLAAAALLAPAAARGATLTTDLPCYVEGQEMTVTGTGWPAGSPWSLAGARDDASGAADAMGGWSADVRAPAVKGQSVTPRPFTLTGSQGGTTLATTTARTVDFLVAAEGAASGRPTSTRLMRFSGFQPGRRIYLHVKRRGTRKVRTRVVGVPEAPCGTFKKRLRRLPAVPTAKIRDGRYVVAYDSRRTYSARTGPQFIFELTIARPAR